MTHDLVIADSPAAAEYERIMSRRRALRAGLKGAFALAALPTLARAIPQTPPLTEGPYWVNGMLNRSDVRTNTSTGVAQVGLPFRLNINVSKIVNNAAVSPLVGAYVDIWHCNVAGAYSDVQQNNTVGQNWLRGYQITDSHGNARFTTVYPGWYQGRSVHIHVRVRKIVNGATTFNFVSQMFFEEAVTTAVYARAPYNARPGNRLQNPSDGIYNSSFNDTVDGSVTSPSGGVLKVRLAQNATAATGSFNMRVRTT